MYIICVCMYFINSKTYILSYFQISEIKMCLIMWYVTLCLPIVFSLFHGGTEINGAFYNQQRPRHDKTCGR